MARYESGQVKRIKGISLISWVLIFSVFMMSLTAFGDDKSSIDTLRQMGKAFASIAQKTSPAVVSVQVEKVIEQSSGQEWPFGDPFGDDFFDHFFYRRSPRQRSPQRSPQRKHRQQGQASGFIISDKGYILTNNHVVEGADKVTVVLADGRKKEAEIIGTDPDTDVAVIKIDAENLSYLKLGDSDKLEVGEWVLAIGNPFGLSHTVTAGIVSAKGRGQIGIAEYEDFIQTDAAINRGNSGGPLINLDGKVVGISTAIVGSTGNIGIGLAIPVNMAKHVYEILVEGKAVTRGVLGIQIDQLDPDLAKKFDVEDGKGVLIVDVFEDTPAEKAGLKRYDVIVKLNGEKVEKVNKFRNRISILGAGTKVELVVLRDGKKKTIKAKLGEKSEVHASIKGTSQESKEIGITVRNLTDELAERFGYEGLKGVVVAQVEPGSVAAYAGLREGLLIEEVDRQPVANIKEFNQAIKKAAQEASVLLLINNGRFRQLLSLPLPKD